MPAEHSDSCIATLQSRVMLRAGSGEVLSTSRSCFLVLGATQPLRGSGHKSRVTQSTPGLNWCSEETQMHSKVEITVATQEAL